MTYNVFGVTLNLAQSINHRPTLMCVYVCVCVLCGLISCCSLVMYDTAGRLSGWRSSLRDCCCRRLVLFSDQYLYFGWWHTHIIIIIIIIIVISYYCCNYSSLTLKKTVSTLSLSTFRHQLKTLFPAFVASGVNFVIKVGAPLPSLPPSPPLPSRPPFLNLPPLP